MSEFAKMTPAERAIKKGYGDEDNPAYCDINGRCFEWETDAEYVDKIIKENEKFKDFSLKVHNFAYGTDWDDKDIVSAIDFDCIIEKMQKDEKELKENEKGIMDYEHNGIMGCNSYERFTHAIAELNYDEKWIKELQEENKKLTNEIDKKDESIAFWEGKSEDKKDIIKKLKKEIEELKKERQESMTILQEANSDIIGDIKKGLTKEKLKKENKELKEENKKLEEGMNIMGSLQQGIDIDNKKLKEENKKLKKRAMPFGWTEESCKNWIEENKELKEENEALLDNNVPIKILNENRELKEENERLDKKVGELQKIRETDIDFDLHNAQVKELKEEHETHIHNLQKSYEVLKSEFQEKRDSLQQHNEILMEQLCGSHD